ncbi:MAG: hypothetical protein KKG47_02570 [Proteobacteria bacterium]|nr:hypothetical protein [Pseudomonadota bacterium]MBU1738024.1 hypothetical protein [Pseudomonadota bacterium]
MSEIKAKTNVNVNAGASARSGVDSVSRGSMITMGVVSSLVGIWAVACLVSAMVDGGPIELLKGWFSAVLGM